MHKENNRDKGVVLKVIRLEGIDLKTVNDVVIADTDKVLIKFNLHGNLFAVYNFKQKEIKIYDIGNDIQNLITKIQKDEPYFSFKVKSDDDLN
jgi:hypothetical protein